MVLIQRGKGHSPHKSAFLTNIFGIIGRGDFRLNWQNGNGIMRVYSVRRGVRFRVLRGDKI